MAHAIESHLATDLAASATAVWDLIADFGALEKWWPPGMLEKVVCEGQGVGMVRHLHIGGGMVLKERLDELDPVSRRLALSIDGDMPAGIEGYSAVGQVMETGPNSCRLLWTGTYRVSSAEDEAEARGFIEGAYAAQAQGVKVYLES